MEPDIVDVIEFDEKHVDIEAIMHQIRQYLAHKHGTQPLISLQAPASSRLARDVYDELYEANQEFDQGHVTPYLTSTHIPVIGGVLQWFRTRLHSLVVFYVDRAADAQIRFNTHVIRVLNGIVHGIDTDQSPDRVRDLERRVEVLEKRLHALGASAETTTSGVQEDS